MVTLCVQSPVQLPWLGNLGGCFGYPGSWHGGSNAQPLTAAPPTSGSPNIRHVLPTGNVPFETSTELSSIMLPSEIINLELPTNGRGVCWKHASVKFDSNGQSRNWYPPPWTARKLVIVSTVEPTSHTVPVSYLGNTREPRSPSLAYVVLVNSPFPGVALYEPLARPQGS